MALLLSTIARLSNTNTFYDILRNKRLKLCICALCPESLFIFCNNLSLNSNLTYLHVESSDVLKDKSTKYIIFHHNDYLEY